MGMYEFVKVVNVGNLIKQQAAHLGALASITESITAKREGGQN